MSEVNSIEYRLIEGFPGYRVGTDGSVWSRMVIVPHQHKGGHSMIGTEWKKLKGKKTNKWGHRSVHLPGKTYRLVAHLVLQAFVGPCPEGMESCHNDGDPTNNRLENLRWDTHRNNIGDKKRHGTEMIGAKNPMAKLTETLVRKIRTEHARGGVSYCALSRKYGLSDSYLRSIVIRQSWPHVI